jgi:hypothetical protein
VRHHATWQHDTDSAAIQIERCSIGMLTEIVSLFEILGISSHMESDVAIASSFALAIVESPFVFSVCRT